jgi:hypothetical protein
VLFFRGQPATDATRFIGGRLRPWPAARPHWDHAAKLVFKAVTTGRRVDVDAVEALVQRTTLSFGRIRLSSVVSSRCGRQAVCAGRDRAA